MNIQELNIGNWILWDNSWNNEPCKVVGIDPPLVKLVDRNNNSISVRINSVKPMKITSQILIKNGFKQVFIDNSCYHTYERENLEISCTKLRDNYRISIDTKNRRMSWTLLNHIHQLQNACRLVGKELDVEL